MRKPPVQHEVNQHPGHAYIHPQRPSPSRNRAMPIIAPPQPAAQRDDHHGHDHDGECDVWDQKPKINRAPNALTQKMNVADVRMEINVTRQKQCRSDHRSDHARAMCCYLSARNQISPNEQQDSADSIQTRDQGREERVLLRDHAAGLVVRRFAIRNANPNITSENRSNVAIAEGKGN